MSRVGEDGLQIGGEGEMVGGEKLQQLCKGSKFLLLLVLAGCGGAVLLLGRVGVEHGVVKSI